MRMTTAAVRISMEEDFSRYCKAYQEMKQHEIDKISEYCKPIFQKGASYRRYFFKTNSDLSDNEWYLWKKYYFSNDWETDIWIMTNDEFKYSWPYHAGFIDEYMLYNSL